MSVITVDRDAAITALDKAVELKGADHVQGACIYIEGMNRRGLAKDHIRPSVGCIVGAGVASIVGETEAIRIFTGTFDDRDPDGDPIVVEANDVGISSVRKHLADNGVVLTDAAFNVWKAAQLRQDEGAPWGWVVERIKEDYLG